MSTTTHTIAAIFDRARAANRAAFLPYFPIGYPDYDTSLDAIEAMAEVGVDGFEIGIPFSDPLADGPTIQAATQVALENGTTVRTCLQAVAELRERGVSQPMLLMGYLNINYQGNIPDHGWKARYRLEHLMTSSKWQKCGKVHFEKIC